MLCKVCPFTALFTTPYSMHVCRYVAIVMEGIPNRVQQGACFARPLRLISNDVMGAVCDALYQNGAKYPPPPPPMNDHKVISVGERTA